LTHICPLYSRIGDNLHETLPSLEAIYLTNNQISELHDIDNLAELDHLTYLSLLGNNITDKPHYRAYVIHKIPQVTPIYTHNLSNVSFI